MAYTKRYEWGGYSIRKAKKGWVVEIDSRISGEHTGVRIWIPFTEFPSGINWEKDLGDCMTMAEYLLQVIRSVPGIRILNKGIRVQ